MKLICLVTIAALACPSSAPAYSVLTHEGIIDASWDASIKPLLRARFPKLSDADLDEARAYSYGGAVIHDLGYYPFGSKLFSNLLHYVRSGDFVEALITDAADVNEYAFALGALAHYAADNNGHPIGVNRVVPIMYPKERARHGDEVTYVEAPKQHLLVEFSFDVVQVAAGAYAPEAFHRFIGFKVAEPLLDRAFLETYGIEMGPLFLDRSLAIGTFRYAVGQAIPQMTKAAWKNKRKEIEKLTPGVTQRSFVFNLPRREYEKEFGHDYAKPTGFARIVSILYHLVPKIGPFRALAFKVPTPEAEKLFLESFARTKERYAQELAELRAGKPALSNTNFDTGQPLTRGRYSLEDEAYDDLIKKLGDRKSGTITPALRSDLIRHFGNNDPRVSKLR
ncbi:MAG TPA: zinc dependent phospholipase C family protein [Vicinamibacterales bacterium]|nr:zinc dependent phospholipase C family protein [Vicinamibacterales bacterium]